MISNWLCRAFYSVLILSSLNAWARPDFTYTSTLPFHKDEKSILDLDSYSLLTNADVTLMIVFFENKALREGIANLDETEMKKRFLSQNVALDFFNGIEDRKIQTFKYSKNENEWRVEIGYTLKKSGQAWREDSVYVVQSNNTAMASLSSPAGLPGEERAVLQKGLSSFHMIDGDETASAQKPDQIDSAWIQARSKGLFASVHLPLVGAALPPAFAEDQKCEQNLPQYVKEGQFNYSTEPGSAVFRFEDIVHDLSEAVHDPSKASQVHCLAEYAKKAHDDADKYWHDRAKKENCPDGADCPDSTKKEMERSANYLINIEKRIDNLMGTDTEGKVCGDHCETPVPDDDVAKKMAALGASAQQSFCCAPKTSESDEAGPLMSILSKQEDGFQQLPQEVQMQRCLVKTNGYKGEGSTGEKTFMSGDGIAHCLGNMYDDIKKTIQEMLHSVTMLFDGELIKGLWHMLTNLPQVFEMMGKQIAAQIYSVTDCMNPYEAKQQMCRMVPEFAAFLFGPALIKVTLKTIAAALVAGGKAAGLIAFGEMVANAGKGSKILQTLKAAGKSAQSGALKVAAKIPGAAIVGASAVAVKEVAKVLGSDWKKGAAQTWAWMKKGAPISLKAKKEAVQQVLNRATASAGADVAAAGAAKAAVVTASDYKKAAVAHEKAMESLQQRLAEIEHDKESGYIKPNLQASADAEAAKIKAEIRKRKSNFTKLTNKYEANREPSLIEKAQTKMDSWKKQWADFQKRRAENKSSRAEMARMEQEYQDTSSSLKKSLAAGKKELESNSLTETQRKNLEAEVARIEKDLGEVESAHAANAVAPAVGISGTATVWQKVKAQVAQTKESWAAYQEKRASDAEAKQLIKDYKSNLKQTQKDLVQVQKDLQNTSLTKSQRRKLLRNSKELENTVRELESRMMGPPLPTLPQRVRMLATQVQNQILDIKQTFRDVQSGARKTWLLSGFKTELAGVVGQISTLKAQLVPENSNLSPEEKKILKEKVDALQEQAGEAAKDLEQLPPPPPAPAVDHAPVTAAPPVAPPPAEKATDAPAPPEPLKPADL